MTLPIKPVFSIPGTGSKLSTIWYDMRQWFSHSLLGRPISDAWYWLRSHTYRRHHIVDCRSPQNGYDYGWVDRDGLMFYACFNILKDFVEKEMYGHVDWDHPEMEEPHKEIKELYGWWVSGRAKDHAEHDKQGESFEIDFTDEGIKVNNEIAWEAWRKREDELEAKDEEMLARLMKVRVYLWT